MSKLFRSKFTIIPLLTCILVLTGMTNVSAAGSLPKGISSELWEAYKEMGTLDLEGGRRNFRLKEFFEWRRVAAESLRQRGSG